MTLKGFHIVFVCLCILLFGFLLFWGFVLSPEKSSLSITMGITGIVGVLLMPIYGVYFLRKVRRNDL